MTDISCWMWRFCLGFFQTWNSCGKKGVWQRNSENENQQEHKKNILKNRQPSSLTKVEFLIQRDLILLIFGRRNVERKDRSVVYFAFPDACCSLLQYGDWAVLKRTLNLYSSKSELDVLIDLNNSVTVSRVHFH